jgi:hypothetical protein
VDKALVKKTNYLLSARQIQRLIDEGHIACPKCGGTKLIWACCGVNVADPDLLKKLRDECRSPMEYRHDTDYKLNDDT